MKTLIKPTYSLPLERTIPSPNLSDYSMLLYGEEKIGKTSLAAQFEKALFLMCEPGGKALSIFKQDIFNWDDFVGYVKALRKDTRFKTVVVDTVDVLYPMMERAVCKELGIDDPTDAGYGKGFRKLDLEFSKWMTFLLKLGKGVIFTSHATEKEVENRSGETIHRTQPTMPKGAAKILEPMVDIWAFYKYRTNGARSIIIAGSDTISAGSRAKGHFLGVREIPAGKSEEEAYKNFVDAFNNKLVIEPPKLKLKMKLK